MRNRQGEAAETDGGRPVGCTAVPNTRPPSAGCRVPDMEALRERVAVLRAQLSFDEDGRFVDGDEPAAAGNPDWAEVEQVIGGLRRRRAPPAAKRIAVQRLTRRGLSAREIGQRIGMTERSVLRYRGGGTA